MTQSAASTASPDEASPDVAPPKDAPARQRAWPRRTLIALIVLLALVVLIRVILDPIAEHYTRQALAEAEGMEGRFDSVHVTVFPPGYEIRDLAIIETPGGNWKRPLFGVERAAISIYWRRLLRGQIATEMRLDAPKIKVTQHSEAPTEVKKEVEKVKPKSANDVPRKLGQMMPARVERIEVRQGEFSFRDADSAGQPEVALHRIEVAVENLATRRRLDNGQPATASLSAVLGKSGELSGFVSADLFAKSINLAGNFALKGWKLAELYELEKANLQLQTPTGTVDVFAEFKVKNGTISGGVKPVLKNVEIRPTEDTLFNKIKAWAADTALDLFSDRIPGRDAVATVVPIQGHIDDPKAQVWPTVLSIVRNAFVEGISSGFSHLPPPRSKDKDGILTQAADALQKDKGPAAAQPEGDGDK
jgi:Domain of Unknown Function (DUF748)